MIAKVQKIIPHILFVALVILIFLPSLEKVESYYAFLIVVIAIEAALIWKRNGSAPNYGVDAIVAASAIIMQLQTLVSRRNDPRDNLAITIGEIVGGTRFNVLADKVVMKGTARTHSREVREKIEGWIRSVVEAVALANGATAELDYEYYPGVLYNDSKLAELAQHAVITLYGEEGLAEHPVTMGSEDFSYFLDKIPGVYALIGIRNEEKGINASNHNPRFQVDESALKYGAALYAQFAYEYLINVKKDDDHE